MLVVNFRTVGVRILCCAYTKLCDTVDILDLNRSLFSVCFSTGEVMNPMRRVLVTSTRSNQGYVCWRHHRRTVLSDELLPHSFFNAEPRVFEKNIFLVLVLVLTAGVDLSLVHRKLDTDPR